MRANRRRKKRTASNGRPLYVRILPPKIERNHAVRHYGEETSRSGIRAVETSDVTSANGSLINFSLNKRYSMAAYKFVKRHYYYYYYYLHPVHFGSRLAATCWIRQGAYVWTNCPDSSGFASTTRENFSVYISDSLSRTYNFLIRFFPAAPCNQLRDKILSWIVMMKVNRFFSILVTTAYNSRYERPTSSTWASRQQQAIEMEEKPKLIAHQLFSGV